MPFIALQDPESRKIFLGVCGDFYVETEIGILSATPGIASLDWDEGFVTNIAPGATLTKAIGQFDKEGDVHRLDARTMSEDELSVWLVKHRTTFWTILSSQFFGAGGPGDSQLGVPRLRGVKILMEKLELDVESPAGHFKATVWIDMKTRRVEKAVQDGKQVFPR